MIAADRPAPNTAAARIASRMPGKAKAMSSDPLTSVSKRPPRHAAAMATMTPRTIDTGDDDEGPTIEVRAPASSRENTSRPLAS